MSAALCASGGQDGNPHFNSRAKRFPWRDNQAVEQIRGLCDAGCAGGEEVSEPNARCVVTGNPVREAFFTADRQAIRKKMGLDGKICVLSFGGSLGARRVNEAMAELIAHNKNNPDIFHIHATGAYGTELFPKTFAGKRSFKQ